MSKTHEERNGDAYYQVMSSTPGIKYDMNSTIL